MRLKLIDNTDKTQEEIKRIEGIELTIDYKGSFEMPENYKEKIDIKSLFGIELKEGYKYLANFPLLHEYDAEGKYIRTIVILSENVASELYYKEMANENEVYKLTPFSSMPDLHYSIGNDSYYINQCKLPYLNSCVPCAFAEKMKLQGANIDVMEIIRATEDYLRKDLTKEGVSAGEIARLLMGNGLIRNGVNNKHPFTYLILDKLINDRHSVIVSTKRGYGANANSRTVDFSIQSAMPHAVLVTGFILKDNQVFWEIWEGTEQGKGIFISEKDLWENTLPYNVIDFDLTDKALNSAMPLKLHNSILRKRRC